MQARALCDAQRRETVGGCESMQDSQTDAGSVSATHFKGYATAFMPEIVHDYAVLGLAPPPAAGQVAERDNISITSSCNLQTIMQNALDTF